MYGETSLSPAVNMSLLTDPRWLFFCGSFLLFMFRGCHAFLSVYCSLVVHCWERLASWLSCMLCFIVFLSLSHVVPCVRCGT